MKISKFIITFATFFTAIVVIGFFGFQYFFQKPITSLIDGNNKTQKVKFNKAIPPYDYWNEQLVGPHLNQLGAVINNALRIVPVHTEGQLLTAIKNAQSGDLILLAPGDYHFSGKSISLNDSGTKNHPIIIAAHTFGKSQLHFNLSEGFHVTAPHWRIMNLIINGVCKDDNNCDHAVHVSGKGNEFVFQNNWVTNFNSPLKVNGTNGNFPDDGIISSNTFFNYTPRKTANPVTFLDMVAVSNWRISQNFIADFAKISGDNISYGMFFKGAGEHNIFERNVVVCEWRHNGGFRVGTSFGGGGTGTTYCRDNSCTIEQANSILRNNVIMNCPEEVGLYINKSKEIIVNNNIFYRTRGIDVRFKSSSTDIFNNIIDGRILARNDAIFNAHHNINHLLDTISLTSAVETIYNAPQAGNFSVKATKNMMSNGFTTKDLGVDLCGIRHTGASNIGPFTDKGVCVPQITIK